LITTIVPGTVWSELARDRSMFLLHVFDLADEAEFVAHFKHRYERPLLEIFE
jgi:multicomponent K+:H+ antiporter subunit E